MRWFIGCILLGFVVSTGLSCRPSAQPIQPPLLPTYAAQATVPPTAPPPSVPPPPTFTPLPTSQPTQTPTATWTPTLFPTATPDLTAGQELEEPPRQIPCGGSGMVFKSRFPSRSVDPWRYYHAYLPPCYGHDGHVYPVLYYMHGSIQDDRHWIDLGIIEHIERGIQSGRYPPFIVVFPYNGRVGNATSGGPWTVEDITVDNLIPYIDEKLCTWAVPAGRSIGGISRGGYWALEIAFRHPHLFGAVSGHSSQLRLEVDGPEYNPRATYAEADLSQMRIWLDWGEEDFLRVGQRDLHEKLMGAGVSHETHIFPGRHNEAYWAAHVGDYLDWHTAAWPPARILYPACER